MTNSASPFSQQRPSIPAVAFAVYYFVLALGNGPLPQMVFSYCSNIVCSIIPRGGFGTGLAAGAVGSPNDPVAALWAGVWGGIGGAIGGGFGGSPAAVGGTIAGVALSLGHMAFVVN